MGEMGGVDIFTLGISGFESLNRVGTWMVM